jgi:hypothetical protein
MALNRRSWLPVTVVVALVGFIAMLALFIWVESNHNAVAAALTGEWVARGSADRSALSIAADERSKGVGFLASDLAIRGSLDGRPVGGKIKLPAFPPWRSTVTTTLLGETWTLRATRYPHVLTLVSASGRTIQFKSPD